ncbi:MAG: hypothetical protein AAFR61_01905 [Bacteroidota bacterium]
MKNNKLLGQGKAFLVLGMLSFSLCSLEAQITYRGCTGILGAQDFTLSNTGTVSDGGTDRNTYESTPSDFAQSCPAGVCEIQVIWSAGNTRWEIQLDTDGPLGTPNYTNAILFYNTSASYPNPPSLDLGTWTEDVASTGGTCATGVTTFSGDVQSTLPVVWADVRLREVGLGIELQWATLAELNNAYYEVERSKNGLDYAFAGKLAGRAEPGSGASYSFLDPGPFYGRWYYRIRQVDLDGTSSYSAVEQIDLHRTPMHISDNGQEMVIHHYFRYGGSIQLRNLSGQILLEQTLAAGTEAVPIPAATFAAGLYTILVEDGPVQQVRKWLNMD